MQLDFILGRGITVGIFIVRQVQEMHQARKKKLYYAFVNMEKPFDKVHEGGGEMVFDKAGCR